ncbi:MAG: MBL fold metallo-hydrolase [Planctomycetes bacterium]|jgi:phosphoribosyl 1,2-cyclic phosphate phosphodiesterase|nr:MBL fold metallo-hydrolase [Planctomycetota bacterium]
MPIELVFLGTGTSAGVPMIGCDCGVCTSDDPRDRRDRPSVLIRYPDTAGDQLARFRGDDDEQPHRQILIDTSPELRQQAIRHRLHHLDGVFYTHAHADHIFGLDDLRRFNAVMNAPIDLYAEPDVIDTLRQMFRYIFEPHRNVNVSFVANLIAHPVEVGVGLPLFGATWTPIRLMHGRQPIVGYRIDQQGVSVAYCTDVSTIPPESYPLLAELDVLVLDALRYRHHPTHLTIEQALRIIDELAPDRAYLTHFAHDVKHADLEADLPDPIAPAYDGLIVRCDDLRPQHP